MRIALFTSNQPRHVALIERLTTLADELFVVQECSTLHVGAVADLHRGSPVMQAYFARVRAAEANVFGGPRFVGCAAENAARARCGPNAAGVHVLALRMGDLSGLPLEPLGPALRADRFVVFGASYIRGALCDALVERAAINIHMGIAPQYRGSSTNFWALYDGRPELVGATLHRLTPGLDSGPILRHALPGAGACDPFLLGMRAVQAAHEALAAELVDARATPVVAQDRSRELRYTRSRDFTDAVAEEFLARAARPGEIGAALARRDLSAFVRPFVWEPPARGGSVEPRPALSAGRMALPARSGR